MRRFISYLAFAFTLAVMVGCVKTDDITSDHQGMVTLKLSNNTLITTRATTSAEEIALNEFWIDKVQCFFTTDDNNIVYASDLITIADEDGSADLNLTIPSSAMTTLFSGTGNVTPKIYVVANVGTKIEAETIAAVKEQAITLEAYTADAAASAQSKFVMDSALTDIKKSGNSIGTTDDQAIDLERAAAKIQVQVNINKSITVGEGDATQTWTPDLSSIEMTYYRSVTSSKLNATATDATARASYTQKSESADFTFAGTEEGSTADAYTLTQKVPFYSYPSSWANTEDNEAYISLLIPWAKNNGTSYLTYSYQIPVNFDGKQLERNHLYQLNVDVGVLGTLEGEVELTPSYVVVDWGTGAINAALSSPKYLVVDETVVNIYNKNQYDIAYASSHPVSAVITKITKPNYSQETESTVTIYNQSTGATTVTPANNISGNKESFTVSIVDGKVRLSHVLNNNNTSDGFDYVPYDITVVVTNEAGMSQTITYKQYPEMYISVTLNTDYNNGGGNNDDKGFAWVNNSRTTLGDLDGFGAGSNSNPNMITITTTALGADSDYIVGDPRVSTINNLNYNNWANVKDINGTTRQLLYYYPTDTSTAASNMISPQFRIASSYGVTSGISFDNAQRRCASYQEDGYPAGRWRVPTTAELKYIVQLSAKGYITILFNNGGNYWAADKKIWVPNSSSGTVTQGSGSSAYVRCVYDDWYWGAERLVTSGATTLTSFTWGDMPR